MSASDALVCPLAPLHPLPRVTAALSGCGGRIREIAEDFEVEEIAAYEPCGEGDHLYLWLQKRDVSGGMLRRILARSLDISDRDIGMAGLKDRRAVTRQWVSIPARHEAQLAELNDDRVQVLAQKRHGNKLRTGHLRGNRFVIRLRGVAPAELETAQLKLDQLATGGFPNFYGSQRMGIGGSTLAAGWALSQGARRTVSVEMPDGSSHRINFRDRQLRRLAASALQSELFNRVVARRMADGTHATVLAGDVCKKRETGGIFVSDDPERDQQRRDAGELVVTGPMWGPKMRRPTDAAAEMERAVLDEMGLTEEHFSAIGSLAAGTRRALTCWPTDVSAAVDDDGLVVRFALQSGSFATVLLHELSGPLPTPAPANANIAGPETACA